MVDNSDSSLFDPTEDGGLSIGYPQFSPPGVASFLPPSLPEPLLSLPTMPAGHQTQSALPASQQHMQQHSASINLPPVLPSAVSGAGSREESAPTQVHTLALRLQHLESLCQDLQREKNVMEDQFGLQRRKFMNLMVEKDEELSQMKRSVEQLSSELQRCQQQLRDREEELRGTITKARESAMREAFDADRIIYEEEIATLRKTIDGEGRGERESLLSPVSNQRRSPSPGDPLLEGDLAKAVEESQMLKAVVVPLEKQEIDQLQLQLNEARQRLQHAEEVKRLESPPLIDMDTTLSDITSPGDNKLQRQLELERSARHDLEMHTKALEYQKAILQEEVGSLQTQLEKVSGKLSSQEESYQQLKQAWDMANQHFIVAQDKLHQKMYFMEQKQQLLQQQKNLSGSPNTNLFPLEDRSVAHSIRQPIKDLSARSHSCSDIRESGGSSQLHTAALESELKRVRERLEQRNATCESYEAQLQRVQEQMLEELDEKDQELVRLREECSKARAGVSRERKAKEELRRNMEQACEQFKAQVEGFQSGLHAEQSKLKSLREQYTQSKHEAQRDLARFSDERVSLFSQISSAQEEYDCLKVVQAEEKERYLEGLRAVSQERTMAEDNVAALQVRLTEVEREKQSSNLNVQLEAARRQIAALELVKAELEQEHKMKEQAVAARSDVEEKSRSFIAEQHQRLEVEAAARHGAEQQVRELQRQVASLRSQLNTSQENQKDFVELSQALQMKLAKIEEEQKLNTASNPS
ncbi:Rab GTPase-binding effector protein 1 [Geodia barretti]|uniref:Rab GTPase-binding effector protein 1 n=1 Tax=Geodia barretti TaxID=519541 RepID=A0AA35WQU3_GEOBA|nr:Rab GTPase-binding effector protein 1 [Geodia barretti]